MNKYSIIFSFILICNLLNAQYRVEKISISGELTAEDAYEPSFGRFDAVELYLTKGDVLSISMSAEFAPFIALVAPSEKYYVEYTKDGRTITDYSKNITESGTWYLSIAADSTGFGKYDLTANYMSANSIYLNSDSDFCTSLKFILEHSKTDFFFIKKSAIDEDNLLWESKIKIPNSLTNQIIFDKKNGSKFSSYLIQSLSKEEVDSFYIIIKNEIENCLGNEWLTSSKDWYKTQNNDRAKELRFVNNIKGVKQSIKILMIETHGAAITYQVTVELGTLK